MEQKKKRAQLQSCTAPLAACCFGAQHHPQQEALGRLRLFAGALHTYIAFTLLIRSQQTFIFNGV